VKSTQKKPSCKKRAADAKKDSTKKVQGGGCDGMIMAKF